MTTSNSQQHLIIQGADVATRTLKELAQLTQAQGIEQINPHAFRVCHVAQADATIRQTVMARCFSEQLDAAFVPASAKLSDIGLFITDMDSTLITIECIDEIADMQGLKPQVAEITEAAMRGELDFAQSLRKRVALLAGLDERALDRVYNERLQLSPGAESLLAKLHAQGTTTVLVSGGFTFFTERLKQRLGLTHTYANVLEVRDGKLTGQVLGDIVDAEAKRQRLLQHKAELGLQRHQILASGDGANDLRMLSEADWAVAYHAKPVVREQAPYTINFGGLNSILNWFLP